ncbi:MAG: VOC family protein [Anaerolineae bacterium]
MNDGRHPSASTTSPSSSPTPPPPFPFWRDALGLVVGGVHAEPAQGVAVTFLPVGEGAVELVEPTDDASGIARFLAARGPGTHVCCLEVEDLDQASPI